MKLLPFITTLAVAFSLNAAPHAGAEEPKPKVWIYSDMSDGTLRGPTHMGTVNDPDDISAMAGYLLMANEFETLGIVVASTHRKEHRETPDQAAWANRHFGEAYRAEVAALNKNIGGYPAEIRFTQSCIKESSERYATGKVYEDLTKYPTVQSLLDTATKQPDGALINVLCWGSLTEPAILVNHCVATKRMDVLKKLRFIAHWTDSSRNQGTPEHPENVANCREDAAACAYMKKSARDGIIRYIECGAIGQSGIVGGGPKGRAYFDAFKAGRLGTIFVEGKFVHGNVDHSDSATYWVLLGNYGVSLNDIASDGTNPPAVEAANEQKFRESSKRIHDELLRRAKAAGRGFKFKSANQP